MLRDPEKDDEGRIKLGASFWKADYPDRDSDFHITNFLENPEKNAVNLFGDHVSNPGFMGYLWDEDEASFPVAFEEVL